MVVQNVRVRRDKLGAMLPELVYAKSTWELRHNVSKRRKECWRERYLGPLTSYSTRSVILGNES